MATVGDFYHLRDDPRWQAREGHRKQRANYFRALLTLEWMIVRELNVHPNDLRNCKVDPKTPLSDMIEIEMSAQRALRNKFFVEVPPVPLAAQL